MIMWILIVLAVPVAIVVYAIVDDFKELIFFAVVLLIFVIIPIAMGIENIQDTYTFQEQAKYLETYVPDDAIENAALTNKRIELNQWLYKAQWAKQKFGIFSLYPAEVLELEPIK